MQALKSHIIQEETALGKAKAQKMTLLQRPEIEAAQSHQQYFSKETLNAKKQLDEVCKQRTETLNAEQRAVEQLRDHLKYQIDVVGPQ